MPDARASIEEIQELDDGVVTKVVDHARNKLLHIRYIYAREDEGDNAKWVQIRHHIDEVKDWTGKLQTEDNQATEPDTTTA
jgi:hypothetical protein